MTSTLDNIPQPAGTIFFSFLQISWKFTIGLLWLYFIVEEKDEYKKISKTTPKGPKIKTVWGENQNEG